MAIHSIKTVRTSDNERFKLLGDVMQGKHYFMYRSDFRHALRTTQNVLYRRISRAFPEPTEHSAYIDQGLSQRRKKFISIGCMRFVGDNRTAILRWAK